LEETLARWRELDRQEELARHQSAPRAELVKLPAPKRLEDDPMYRERLRHKLERQRLTGVPQSME
jgi:hypothetical protein